ncbi:hypothetical protein ALC57_14053 [Trachymyrmex cornetzi]|uniref:Uncharacterized protein n=1 Tax=Trachymyrmex cornetzi TaxID=471704 RepID=A0A151IYX6_9HYME|nr:hypothetical protein ALC57_14053 [Trachymyrmex cornetzi]
MEKGAPRAPPRNRLIKLGLCIEYRSEKQFCQWKVSYGQKTAFHSLQKLLCEMEKVCQIKIKRIVCLFLHNDTVCNWSESQLVNTIARCAKWSQLLYLVVFYRWNSVSSPNTEYSCRIRVTAYNAQDNYTGMAVVRTDDGARFDIVLFTKLCHVYMKHFILLFTFLVDKFCWDKKKKSYINYILPISRSTSEQPQHRYNLHKTLWIYGEGKKMLAKLLDHKEDFEGSLGRFRSLEDHHSV